MRRIIDITLRALLAGGYIAFIAYGCAQEALHAGFAP